MSHGAIYDPYGDRMIIFGGFGGGSLNDLRELSLSGAPTWSLLTPPGSVPGPRYGHTFVLDPNRQRAVLYAGTFLGSENRYFDLWDLRLSGGPMEWRQRSPSGAILSARFGHVAILDAVNDRMLVSGGFGSAATLYDVWRLQWFSDIPTAATMSLISSDVNADRVELRWGVTAANGSPCRLERKRESEAWRTVDSAVLDGSGAITFVDRAVAAGSRYGYRLVVSESGEETLSPETWIDTPSGAAFSLHGFSPNPSFGPARVQFSLPDSRPATIQLVDVSGRRIAERRIESPAAGATTVEIAPEGGLAPGLYFIRLTQGNRTVVRRGTLMR
jgi:hypothetical protein